MAHDRTLMAVHWLHIFFGTYWMGTVLFTRIQLFPSLRSLTSEQNAALRAVLVTNRNRRMNVVVAVATVSLGILRGLLGWRGLPDPATSYGVTYFVAASLGIAMVVFLVAPGGRSRLLRNLYVAAFPVVLTCMVLLRFGGW